jgi:hypothetical protein
MPKECAECRDGDVIYTESDVELVYVKNPDNGKLVKRAYMCEEHQSMYLDDGYIVKAA